MTKRDALRTLQTSILTQHEADKTRSGSEMGCPSEHMLHRDKAPERDKGVRQRGRRKGVNARHDKRDKQTDRLADEQKDREVRVREIIKRKVEGRVDVEKDGEAVRERKEGTRGVRG